MLSLTFLGAAGTVTGSKTLITAGTQHYLVDCGLFQGAKDIRNRNWAKLPFPPQQINAVMLTHAHIDHSGYIPLLIKNGYARRIYAPQATCDLCEILLPDSGQIQEEDARFANRHGFTEHHPALPLYTRADAEYALHFFSPVAFDRPFTLAPETTASWHRTGHILGAANLYFEFYGASVLFSGDIGRSHDPIMRPPTNPPAADFLVIESTYGNRSHGTGDPKKMLGEVINRTIQRGGSVIIPAFAVGRTQNILYYILQLQKEGAIPPIPVYLDSPMAVSVTKLLITHRREHLLSIETCRQLGQVAHYVTTPEESKQLDQMLSPCVLISASGMVTGGRVLHHLKALAPDPRHTILFTGFQPDGTRGAQILAGEKEVIIHGQVVKIEAEVVVLPNSSAHADSDELLAWCRKLSRPPQKVFIIHGEENSAEVLSKRITSELGWQCILPRYGDKAVLVG